MEDSRSSRDLALRASEQILEIRGHRVLLDADLAAIYGVSTKSFNQAVSRHRRRFPADFAFRLTDEEFAILRSQIVTSSSSWGGRRFPPWVFTEHGAIMAAAVLRSDRAVEMSVFVVRAFVRLRDFANKHADLARHLDALERRVTAHDADLKQVFSALRRLLEQPPVQRRRIGFSS